MGNSFHIDRRTTLGWLSGAVAGMNLGFVPSARAAADAAGAPMGPAQGYGNDPNLLDPKVPWPRTMSARQLQLSGVLADMILPPVGTSPAPSTVGVPDFVDEWVSAPYPDQQRDRGLILPGLAWLDSESAQRWGKSFTDATADQRMQLLTEISAPPTTEDKMAALRYGFFRRFRTVAVGAYYSLEQNFAEIGYVGNQPLEAFPPPTEEEKHLINKAIAKLGL